MDELFDQLTDEIVSLREKIELLQAEIDRLTRSLADMQAKAILEDAGFEQPEE